MVHASGVCPVLIGRQAELAALQECLEQVQSGKGQIALLSGEAGIGKSRLMSELKTEALAQGFQSLQGQCFPSDHSCPYAPLLDLLRSLLLHAPASHPAADLAPFARELTPLLPEVSQLFPELAELSPLPTLEPEQEKRRLFAALARFFFQQAATRPLLLIVEDVHWSDATSLEFLHYLARHGTAQPLLLLLTYRSEEMDPGLGSFLSTLDRAHLAREVVLSRLTRSETDAMVRAMFDLPPPWQAAALPAIYELTEGNPFFIEELLKSLVATDELANTPGSWERTSLETRPIPRSIQVAVKLRADQVSSAAREVLHLAAVAGRRFDFAVLQQITHADERQLLTLMKELLVAQLVVEEAADHFAFRHALTRQTIYADLLGRERQALHRAIAETMEQLYHAELSAHLADLASHFAEAGVWEKALEYAQRAGEQAQRLYAPRTAIEQYTRALESLHHLAFTPPPALYRARGQAYETLGAFEPARRDYEQALEGAHTSHDSRAEWQSLIDLGFLWAGRDYARAGTFFRRATERARVLAEPNLLAHSLNRLGNWYMNAEHPLEALRCHHEALTTFQEVQDQHGVAQTLDLLGVTHYLGGDLLRSHACYDQAIALFQERDDRQALVSALATRLLCSGNFQTETLVPVMTSQDEGMSQGNLAWTLARQIGQRAGEAFAGDSFALWLGARGEYRRALELAQQGLEITQEIEHRQWLTAVHWAFGLLYRDLLALSLAQQHLERALALAQEIGSPVWTRLATGPLALVWLAQHDAPRAEALLKAALSLDGPPHTLTQRLIWYGRAHLALAQGKPDRGLAIIDQLLGSAVNVANEQSLPHLAHTRGKALMRLQRLAEAEMSLQAAQAGARIQGVRPLLWRIAIDLGSLYLAQRRDEEALHAFTTAKEIIAALAAPIPDTSLREQFLQQATALIPRQAPLAPRRATKKAFDGLTEREREVAALIAQGKANREIAQVLVVNYRTVEKHIENMRSKLGFTSRAQIAVWALEKGLLKHEQRSP